MPREDLILKCTECGEENYITTKNRKSHPDRMEIKKYCSRCNKMTVHKEKK
jgi:large subunit ribosomal protein L33